MAVCMKCTFCLVGLYQHQWCLLTDLLFLFKSRLMHCHFSQGVFFMIVLVLWHIFHSEEVKTLYNSQETSWREHTWPNRKKVADTTRCHIVFLLPKAKALATNSAGREAKCMLPT